MWYNDHMLENQDQQFEWGVLPHLEHEADKLYTGLGSVEELCDRFSPEEIDQILDCNSRKYNSGE